MMEFQTESFCRCSLLCNQLGIQNPKRNDGTWSEYMHCKKYSQDLKIFFGEIVIRCDECIDENTFHIETPLLIQKIIKLLG